MKAWMYSTWYRRFPVPWDIGPRPELIDLVKSGRIKPCRAIDLGCGTGSNAIFLAQHGFEVTGVDFARGAIEKAVAKRNASGVNVEFAVGDLTDLRGVSGPFGFALDYGVLDDLTHKDRAKYVDTLLKLTAPGSQYLLWCFEWAPRWWERPWHQFMALVPGEAEARFGPYFDIDKVAGQEFDSSKYPPAFSAYLMRRRLYSPN
ncbi:MAG: hypothetical protein AUJ02_09650 [Chloroflexi bacterium 13_1_40CM_3_65_12]|nr:MAG: hypothetical protein AUJ02_09650 [Chloroflexi bacterium 13_1_40CM_3_65_12]